MSRMSGCTVRADFSTRKMRPTIWSMSGRGVAISKVFKVGTSNPSLHIAYVAIKTRFVEQISARLSDFTVWDRIADCACIGSDNAANKSFVC
jgi:hypothetical protein